MVVTGTGAGSGASKSATHSPAPNGLDVLRSPRRRMLQAVVNSSQKNSSSVSPARARARVKYSVWCISSSSVSARFPVMPRIVLRPPAPA